MTKMQMMHIAQRKMFMHWAKLYFPNIIKDWKPIKTDDEAADERFAFWSVCAYMNRPGSAGLRLYALLQTIDIRETRQLCLGESIPVFLEEETGLILKEAEELFEKCTSNRSSFNGMNPALVAWYS
jgi:hypothetical protein